jgi:hypothetical protein
LKAGRAGSNPDVAAVPTLGPAQPLRDFLRAVGEAVANLNTTVVGLDAVETGHEKPAGLNISWNPGDRVAAARKARRFVLEAVLVRVAEAIHEFVWVTAQLPRFKSVREGWTKNTAGAEKLADVAAETLGVESYIAAGATLLVHWRNRVVHLGSRAEPTPQQKKTLAKAANEIEEKYAGASIERLMQDFQTGHPTLKDVSTLISMSIRMARAIDAEINVLSEEDLDVLLDHYNLNARIIAIEAQTAPTKRIESVLRFLQSAAPSLAQSYRRLRIDNQ